MRTRLDQQKRQHRERGQLVGRQRLGLLEKHKDYVLRARDYHSKEDRIKTLRQKAATRNKDEFYFGMLRSRTEGGVHVQDRGNEAMPVDVVKLLKTQDAGYVRTLISTEEKLIERLRNQVGSSLVLQEEEEAEHEAARGRKAQHNLYDDSEDEFEEDDRGEGGSSSSSSSSGHRGGRLTKSYVLSLLSKDGAPVQQLQGKKTVFVDSAKQVAKYKPPRVLGTAAQSKKNKKRASDPNDNVKGKGKGKGKAAEVDGDEGGEAYEDEDASSTRLATLGERKEHLSTLTHELSARLNRLALLQRTLREMQVQRALMGNGSKQVVGGSRKGALSREEERLNENDYDELELKRLNSQKRRLPKPELGIRTGARVWKWKAERKR